MDETQNQQPAETVDESSNCSDTNKAIAVLVFVTLFGGCALSFALNSNPVVSQWTPSVLASCGNVQSQTHFQLTLYYNVIQRSVCHDWNTTTTFGMIEIAQTPLDLKTGFRVKLNTVNGQIVHAESFGFDGTSRDPSNFLQSVIIDNERPLGTKMLEELIDPILKKEKLN
ncbi:MAG: hypothetical protein WC797_00545 [Candidatus Paceibacterota bacterium]|jgi:hypothetical protein